LSFPAKPPIGEGDFPYAEKDLTMADLALVATTDLLNELHGRYDTSVFVGLRDLSVDDEEPDVSYLGGTFCVLGLLAWLQKSLLQGLPSGGE
jgi:hypothetical protein